ncbi:hypothetical protein [Rhizobium sp. AC44/96]|uniref:hypothetical protein n=1 Tax=Rhizobium sp. AC44/96 TaxID=1841654 RepID=UPI0018E9387C|nr:hypothetical protein [Rhizobium sp. AC44/96]
MPAGQSHIERIALPRSLVGRRRPTFEFRIGQLVDFHGDRAVITGRQLTAMGREIYDITIQCAERQQRTVRGQYLAPVHDETKTGTRRAPVRTARGTVRVLPEVRPPELLAA